MEAVRKVIAKQTKGEPLNRCGGGGEKAIHIMNTTMETTTQASSSVRTTGSSSYYGTDDTNSRSSSGANNHHTTRMAQSASSSIVTTTHYLAAAAEASGELTVVSLPSADHTIRSSLQAQGLTLNKLNYNAVGLVGRESHVTILQKCVKRLLHSGPTCKTNERDDHPSSSSSNHHHHKQHRPQQQPQPPRRELLLIKGRSGAGKTHLALSVQSHVRAQGGIYVGGKFDFSRPEPYTGIAMACRAIVGEILLLQNNTAGGDSSHHNHSNHNSNNSAKFQSIQQELQSAFGAELQYLTHVLPELWELLDLDIGRQNNGTTNETDGTHNDTNNMEPTSSRAATDETMRLALALQDDVNQGSVDAQHQQINYAFRLFLRLVCQHFSLVTILLDDLQWADAASLQVLQHLISDRENEHSLLLIGCYRSNEVDVVVKTNDDDDGDDDEKDVQGFQTTLEGLRATSQRDGFHIEELEVGNLTVNEVNQILQALLSMDDESKTLELAKLVHNRTQGNAYFCTAFITMLYNESMLTYNFGIMDWKWWNVEDISANTSSTENVVDIMKSKMDRLPPNLQSLLQFAACLGSVFESYILEMAWQKRANRDDREQPTTSFQDLLEQVVQDNFLERIGNGNKYSWVHDKVQEAALSLIPPEILTTFQFGVGMSLYQNIKHDKKELESSIFILVNLLNKYPHDTDAATKLEIVQLNLMAAQTALVGSAFVNASRFAAEGIQLLPDDKWTSQYSLTLELYSIGAEAEGIRGNIDGAKAYCDEVLNNASNVTDKLRVYYSFMDTLTNCNRAADATEVCLDVLAQLDCPFPKKVLGRTWKAIRTILKISNGKYIPTQVEVEKLPLIADPAKAEVMKLLNMLTTQCYYTKNMLLFVLVFYKMFSWTLEYGICDFSPQAFNGYGIIFSGVLGDFQGASKLGEYALQMHEHRLSTKATISRTYQATYTFLLPWTKPLRSSLNPYLVGYKVGMQAGDTESAMWCLHFYISALVVTGKSLGDIEAACRTYLPQMEELRREVAFESTQILLQCVLNFMGLSPNTFVLTGEVIDEEEWIKNARDTKNETNLNGVDLYKSWLYAYMGEHRLGAKLALKKGDKFLKETPGFFCCMPEAFCRAISLFVTARKTKKRKYKKAAMGVRKTIQSWLDKGNPNVIHYVALLDAEEKALRGKKEEARQLYSKALVLATRGGFLQDAALVNECYADFLLNDCKDKEEGAHYIKRAEECYREWGATAKVKQLREKYYDLLDIYPGSSTALFSTGLRQEKSSDDGMSSSLGFASGFLRDS